MRPLSNTIFFHEAALKKLPHLFSSFLSLHCGQRGAVWKLIKVVIDVIFAWPRKFQGFLVIVIEWLDPALSKLC